MGLTRRPNKGKPMSDSSDRLDPKHLSNRHCDTLTAIYQHPVSHNVRWKDVVSLLNAVGTVEEEHNGKLKVHVGNETEVFHHPHGNDATEQQIVDLRRMLKSAGLQPAKPGAED